MLMNEGASETLPKTDLAPRCEPGTLGRHRGARCDLHSAIVWGSEAGG
jgi:hypothetical protein